MDPQKYAVFDAAPTEARLYRLEKEEETLPHLTSPQAKYR
jgi:hypothetical protein